MGLAKLVQKFPKMFVSLAGFVEDGHDSSFSQFAADVCGHSFTDSFAGAPTRECVVELSRSNCGFAEKSAVI
jgi:hypothetical protein